MPKKHLKKVAMPNSWPLPKKGGKFILRTMPAGTEMNLCIPLGIVIRDLMKLASTIKEVKLILNNEEILVNCKRIREIKYPVCFLDTISIPSQKKHIRLSINNREKLIIVDITKEEENIKPCQIIKKTILGKDRIQINLHDGNNVLMKGIKDIKEYRIGDTVLIDMKTKKIVKHLPLKEGVEIFIFKGVHTASKGIVKEIKGNSIFFTYGDGKIVQTKKSYAIVKDKGVTY